MKVECYLIIQGVEPRAIHMREERREVGSLRLTKKRPATAPDEIAINLNLDIPDALFIKPTLHASIAVPDNFGLAPEITAEVADNIAEVLRQQTGLRVHISADGGPEES